MKKLLKTLLLTLTITAILAPFSTVEARRSRRSSSSDSKTWGVGVNLGEPMGFNTRFYFLDHLAGDLTLGYGFEEEGFIIQPSLLFRLNGILDYNGGDFTVVPYFGTGFKTGVAKNDKAVGAMRFPVGVAWQLSDGEFEIGVELAPGFEFSPESEFDMTGGLQLRYFFF
ncbi:MAG: hypothetical protein IPJ69_07845 [Deltaproteobacteria bacterium]|nr:MAG: hypothetical protein IPJ69_07845 [Deltaproteobacteria bacterium]